MEVLGFLVFGGCLLMALIAFVSTMDAATGNAEQPSGPKPSFKIETRATGYGPIHFVYRHLGFPAGWSITSEFSSTSLEACENWVARAREIPEATRYR